nr:hypothetical protein [Tanacetum cinerariifolium]
NDVDEDLKDLAMCDFSYDALCTHWLSFKGITLLCLVSRFIVTMEILLETTSNKLLIGLDNGVTSSFQLESNSSPHAHAYTTKTYYKHQDLRIMKARELETKTSTNSNIQDLPLRYQVYQGRFLASFQDDAKLMEKSGRLSTYKYTLSWKLESRKMIEVVDYQLRTPVYDIPLGSLIPFHLMKNENWVMCSYENHQIYKVDLKKKIYIKDKDEGKEKGSIYDDFEYVKVSVGDDMNIVDEEVRYIETFVSPNRYMK